MRIEQGVKVVEKGDKYYLLFIRTNEHYVKEVNSGGFVVCKATMENDRKIISVPLRDTPESAIAIAKKLNEDLKRGDV